MNSSTVPSANAVDLYLELLKRCLTREAFPERYTSLPTKGWRAQLARLPRRALAAGGLELVRLMPSDAQIRAEGRDWPAGAETMIGRRRLDNLHRCLVGALTEGVPGDFMETGVWRGGSVIFMRAALAARGDPTRCVWVADSFQGLPPPDTKAYPADAGDSLWEMPELAVGMEEVKANFARYGLLDERVRFLPGWFRDTLPTAPVDELAVLRLDGDLYESTMVALESLYPKLSVGGYLIVDDYGAMESCRSAVHDYRSAHRIEEPIVPVDWTGVYWRRES
ncbi:MAG: TylF/MycF family methyltransferase [Acidimicrobiales bacterium]